MESFLHSDDNGMKTPLIANGNTHGNINQQNNFEEFLESQSYSLPPKAKWNAAGLRIKQIKNEITEKTRRDYINSHKTQDRSPLLLAAAKRDWEGVHTLIRSGADFSVIDPRGHNILHFVVIGGGNVADLADIINKYSNNGIGKLMPMLAKQDNAGNSPLHYASQDGYIDSVEALIMMGAPIRLKNHNKENSLHIAVRNGRSKTVKKLIEASQYVSIIDEIDGDGMTPLDIAAQHGRKHIVRFLLEEGCSIVNGNRKGRNALHLAALSGSTEIIELLLSKFPEILNVVDYDGNTALHLATIANEPNAIRCLLTLKCDLLFNKKHFSALDYAISRNYPKAALAMLTHKHRSSDVMKLKPKYYSCVTFALIESMPKVFETLLHRSIKEENTQEDASEIYIKYSFGLLTSEEDRVGPLSALNKMVEHNRDELLSHELCQKYLQMKWLTYGKKYYVLSLIFYIIFLIGITTYVILMINYITLEVKPPCCISRRDVNSTTSVNKDGTNEEEKLKNPPKGMLICAYVLVLKIIHFICSEILTIFNEGRYFRPTKITVANFCLHISTLILLGPLFHESVTNIHYIAAASAIFLAWFGQLLNLNKFAELGIYVEMFKKVLKTSIKVIAVFSILIIAFGLAFYILLFTKKERNENHLAFSNIPLSMLRIITMTLGELEFSQTYVSTYFKKSLKVPIIIFIFLCIFIILMPILLMNLFIGLAIGDIDEIRRIAQLKRLAVIVKMHTSIERRTPRIFIGGDKAFKKEITDKHYKHKNSEKSKSSCFGFFKSVIEKWTRLVFDEEHEFDCVTCENEDDNINTKFEKIMQNQRNMNDVMDRLHQLLRLIVDNSKIKTECDDFDEGAYPLHSKALTYNSIGSRWIAEQDAVVENSKVQDYLSIPGTLEFLSLYNHVKLRAFKLPEQNRKKCETALDLLEQDPEMQDIPGVRVLSSVCNDLKLNSYPRNMSGTNWSRLSGGSSNGILDKVEMRDSVSLYGVGKQGSNLRKISGSNLIRFSGGSSNGILEKAEMRDSVSLYGDGKQGLNQRKISRPNLFRSISAEQEEDVIKKIDHYKCGY